MDYLKQLISSKPETTSVNLSNRKIEDSRSLFALLKKMPQIEELNLSDNKLAKLPSSLSYLQALHTVNISNNPFSSYEEIVSALKTLPKLTNLFITLTQQNEVELVLSNLEHLKVLNGQEVDKEDNSNEEEEEEGKESHEESPKEEEKGQEVEAKVDEENPAPHNESPKKPEPKIKELKPDDLEEAVKIYDSIRAYRKKIDPKKDKTLAAEFDAKMATVISALKNGLKSGVHPAMRNSVILRAKALLIGISLEKMIETSTDRHTDSIWKGIKTCYSNVIDDLLSVIDTLNATLTDVEEGQKLDGKDTDNQKLIEEIETLKKEIETGKEERENLNLQFEKEKSELKETVAKLEEENKKCVDALLKHTKNNKSLGGLSFVQSSSRERALKQGGESLKESKGRASPSIIQGPSKLLTLKQLKDLILDIYAQKSKYDQRCSDSRLPRETMEQYMYTYLNQVYGLKSLIIEGATGIINGIKKFSSMDSDVALFGKILRNECDEDFRVVFNQAKVAMGDILKEKLKKKFKNKGEPEIAKMVRDIQQGDIDEFYWIGIIQKMYSEEHYTLLEQQIRAKIDEKPSPSRPESKKLTREEQMHLQEKKENKLPYLDFQKIVLDFQLATHENYLKKFTHLFKQIDADTDGVLNEEEFKQLIDEMGAAEEEKDLDRLLQVIDPYNLKKITFSECLFLFTSESCSVQIADEQGSTITKQVSLLEKYTMEGDN